MPIEEKYTESLLISTLSKPMMIPEIESTLGCSRRTVWNMLQKLLSEKKVGRRNRCSVKRPIYEYFLIEKQIQIQPKKKSLKDLCHEI